MAHYVGKDFQRRQGGRSVCRLEFGRCRRQTVAVRPLCKIVGAGLCLSADSSMARGEKCGGSQLRERAP